jgi:GTP-binding protein LepA
MVSRNSWNGWCATFPPPAGDADAPLRALVFDSHFDAYRGVVCSIRVVDGRISRGQQVRFMATGDDHGVSEIGVLTPKATPVETLGPGEVGYLITGVKEIDRIKVGDTVTSAARPAPGPLPGYEEPKPMVFSGIFPTDGDDFEDLREALEKLRLNDSSLVYEPETSKALGFGFRTSGSSACCTWRSCGSGSSESTTSTSWPPRRRWPITW